MEFSSAHDYHHDTMKKGGLFFLLLGAALLLAVSVDGARVLTQQTAAAAAAEKPAAPVVDVVTPTPTNDDDNNDDKTPSTTTTTNNNNDNKLSVALTADAASTKDAYPLCATCVEFATKSIDYLLNAILNEGVVSTCEQLCAYVPGAVEEQVCTMVCDVAGVAGFVKAVNEADLDGIHLCEMLTRAASPCAPCNTARRRNPIAWSQGFWP